MDDPLGWLADELAELDRRRWRRQLRTRQGPNAPWIDLDGQPLRQFGSNDYLGLAADPRVIAAATAGAQAEGAGSGASPLISGRSAIHERLENRLAALEGSERALLFNSGFSANLGAIAPLVGPADLVFSDELNHASLIDGCRLARAPVCIYPHGDMASLDRLLADSRSQGVRRRLIVTESLFSMDGDVAPLDVLAELATRYGAMWLVDEAHATGVFGPGGEGLAASFGSDVATRVDIRVGTLSKALGSSGGFITGRALLIDALLNRMRSYIFSTALPASAAAAALKSLEVVATEPQRRETLLARSSWLRDQLRADGWNLGHSNSQIIPLIVGDEQRALHLGSRLADAGLFVPVIRPPSVPPGGARLRISLTSFHDEAALDALLTALRREGGG